MSVLRSRKFKLEDTKDSIGKPTFLNDKSKQSSVHNTFLNKNFPRE